MKTISEMKMSSYSQELMQSRASWKFSAINDTVRIGVDVAAY